MDWLLVYWGGCQIFMLFLQFLWIPCWRRGGDIFGRCFLLNLFWRRILLFSHSLETRQSLVRLPLKSIIIRIVSTIFETLIPKFEGIKDRVFRGHLIRGVAGLVDIGLIHDLGRLDLGGVILSLGLDVIFCRGFDEICRSYSCYFSAFNRSY